MQAGRPEAGLPYATRAAALAANDPYALGTLAWLQQACGRYEEGLRTANRAVASNPDYEWAHRLRGWALWMMGRQEAAADAMAEAVRVGPTQVYALVRLAWFGSLVGRVDEAMSAGRRAVEVAPESDDAWFSLGWAAWAARDWSLAEQALRESRRLAPAGSNAHNNLGALIARLGRYEEALECFRRALELDHESRYAYENAAYCLRSLGRWDEAEELERRDALNRYHSADRLLQQRRTPAQLVSRAQALRELGRSEEGYNDVREAVELAETPDELMRPLRSLASFETVRGDDEAALATARRLFDEFADSAFTLGVVTWIGWLCGDPSLAHEASEVSAAEGFSPGAVASAHAEACLASGDLNGARTHLGRRLELTRNLRECCAHAQLAFIAERQGDELGAAQELREAERGDPACSTIEVLRDRGMVTIDWRAALGEV
jgi:tetratricopeptide (TPR) repeat protein